MSPQKCLRRKSSKSKILRPFQNSKVLFGFQQQGPQTKHAKNHGEVARSLRNATHEFLFTIATVPRATCRLGIKRFLASIDCAPVSATATEQRSSLVNAAGCISGWYQFSPGSETETQARDSATDLINLDKLARALYRLPSLPRGQYPS